MTARLVAVARLSKHGPMFAITCLLVSFVAPFVSVLNQNLPSMMPSYLIPAADHAKQLLFIPLYGAVILALIALLGPNYTAVPPWPVSVSMCIISVSGGFRLKDLWRTELMQNCTAIARLLCTFLCATGHLSIWAAFRCSTVTVSIVNCFNIGVIFFSVGGAKDGGYPPLGGSLEGAVVNSFVIIIVALRLHLQNRECLCQAFGLDRGLSLPLQALRGIADMNIMQTMTRPVRARPASTTSSEAGRRIAVNRLLDSCSSYGTESELEVLTGGIYSYPSPQHVESQYGGGGDVPSGV